MGKATIEFKTVTPAFIHREPPGKAEREPRGEAEFRIPSLRGVLRFWTRAVYGPFFGNPKELFRKESELWGKTEWASRVRLRVDGVTPEETRQHPLLPHSPERKSPSTALSPNRTYRVRIDGSRESLREAICILRLATVLGGLGQRSRRGAGSFDVQVLEAPEDLEERYRNPLPQDPERLAQWIRGTIQHLQRNMGQPAHSGEAPFPMLCPAPHACASIRVRRGSAADAENARRDIMIALRGYKSPSWGLPYLKPRAGHPTIGGRDVRWASPAHFRILRGDRGVLEVLTVLKSPFPSVIPMDLRNWNEVDRFARNFGGVVAWP
ncbi:MAG TPA: type III-B CRISPR module RAMP protein Cmr1 [Planctomycetota bacterium]|nr:type III-B CRISPR module RAMP protein Cmr1 [Planctomycetota bacterium]